MNIYRSTIVFCAYVFMALICFIFIASISMLGDQNEIGSLKHFKLHQVPMMLKT